MPGGKAGRSVVTCGSLKEVTSLEIIVQTAEETGRAPSRLAAVDFGLAGGGGDKVKVGELGGDKVMSDTTEMTFGLMVHRGKQPDLTLAQQRDWLLCSWVLRQQGSQQTPVHLDSSDVIVTVPDTRLRSNNATKYIVDPNVIFRGPYDAMITSGNDVMQTSAGDVMFMRN